MDMLRSVAEYAAEQLRADPDAQDVRRRHADYFLDFARSGEALSLGAKHESWFMRLDREAGNLQVAGRCFASLADTNALAELSWALLIDLWLRGRLRDAAEWLTAADPDDPTLSARNRGHLLVDLATMAWEADDRQHTEKRARNVLDALGADDTRAVVAAMQFLAYGQLLDGRVDEAAQTAADSWNQANRAGVVAAPGRADPCCGRNGSRPTRSRPGTTGDVPPHRSAARALAAARNRAQPIGMPGNTRR
jgi:hypothetical protein